MTLLLQVLLIIKGLIVNRRIAIKCTASAHFDQSRWGVFLSESVLEKRSWDGQIWKRPSLFRGGRHLALHVLIDVNIDQKHEYRNGTENSETNDRNPVTHFLLGFL